MCNCFGGQFLELATEMALYYKISDAPLWEKLLEELLKARMVREHSLCMS